MAYAPDIIRAAYAALLMAAAAWDIGRRRIPNRVSGAVLGVGLLGACLHGGAGAALSGLAAVVLTVAIGYLPWSRGRVGGGDVKLGAAAAGLIGVHLLPEYLLATALAGAVVSAVCYLLSSRMVRREMALNLKMVTVGVIPEPSLRGGNGRVSVPYGVAFVMAALWIVFVRRG